MNSIHLVQVILLTSGTILLASAAALVWFRSRMENNFDLEPTDKAKPVPVPRIVRAGRNIEQFKKTVKMEIKSTAVSFKQSMSLSQKMLIMGITPPESQ